MEREEKIKIAVTAGIIAVVMLILVLFLALGGIGSKKNSDEEKLAENIAEYADAGSGLVDTNAQDSVSDESDNADGAETQSDIKSADNEATNPSAEKTSSDSKNLAGADGKTSGRNTVSGNSFYKTESAVLKDVYKNVTFNRNQQMAEMYGYWSEGNMEAVRDLAHLERFEAMSYSLMGTMDFYYYGDTNSEGIPNGMGLAAYAEDQYYYGQWVNGTRSGDGCWISFYPAYSNYVVKEHMYTGQWASDLPNGQGQEHYDYDSDLMNAEDVYLQNAIGGFSIGNYNGDMYVITVDEDEDTTEWVGQCENGNWIPVPHASKDNTGKIPYLSERENTERHLYMTESASKANGVSDVLTGGRVRN